MNSQAEFKRKAPARDFTYSSTVIAVVFTVWFALANVIKYIPFLSFLVDTNQAGNSFGKFQTPWWILTICLLVFQTVFTVHRNSVLKRMHRTIDSQRFYISSRDKLLKFHLQCRKTHNSDLHREISDAHDFKRMPRIATRFSKDQLECFLDELEDKVRTEWFSNQRALEIVSMAYRFPGGMWEWVKPPNQSTLSPTELDNNPNSSFKRCQSAEAGYLFYNDKNLAAADNCYAYDIDEYKNGVGYANGSIFCQHLKIPVGDALIEAVISVSTKDGKLIDDSSKEHKKNLKKMDEYWYKYFFDEMRLKLENDLLSLYIVDLEKHAEPPHEPDTE